MTFAIAFPNIDPVIFAVGPIAIRWYSLAYIGGLLLGWWYMKRLVGQLPDTPGWPAAARSYDVDDFLVWATLGVILGGRMGYVLFYNPAYFLDNPLAIFTVWRGGMSFHGGFLGVVIAGLLFVRRRGIPALAFGDACAAVAPIGLFFGRLANFINGELYGRVTDVPWGVIFPRGGKAARHPSQLYEALLEGLALFIILFVLSRSETVRHRSGILTGVFLLGYGAARSFVELFRQPDAHIGFLSFGSTMGQMLSVPMIAVGLYLIGRAYRTE